jgi:hypothetical protein
MQMQTALMMTKAMLTEMQGSRKVIEKCWIFSSYTPPVKCNIADTACVNTTEGMQMLVLQASTANRPL